MQSSIPADLLEIYRSYEAALFANEMHKITDYFADSPLTVRYGMFEVQKGHAEIALHNARQPVIDRRFTALDLEGLEIAPGVIVLTTTFTRDSDGATGRQSQVWVQGENGWKIAHAHVSLAPLTRTGLPA